MTINRIEIKDKMAPRTIMSMAMSSFTRGVIDSQKPINLLVHVNDPQLGAVLFEFWNNWRDPELYTLFQFVFTVNMKWLDSIWEQATNTCLTLAQAYPSQVYPNSLRDILAFHRRLGEICFLANRKLPVDTSLSKDVKVQQQLEQGDAFILDHILKNN